MFTSRIILKIPQSYYSMRCYNNRARIGAREVVGFGTNGSYVYRDDVHFPFPSIRFRENTAQTVSMKLRETGDWRLLHIDDKKALYRYSFCQTFAEFQHPTGLWKLVAGSVLFLTAFAFWMQMYYHFYVKDELPIHSQPLSQRHQLRRMIELHVNPIDGLTSEWDYISDRWKWDPRPKVIIED